MRVIGGWLDGHHIRKARKSYHCEYWRGRSNGGLCCAPISIGAFYVEGELSDGGQTRNGVFLQDKYCPTCAGEEAVATIALVGC